MRVELLVISELCKMCWTIFACKEFVFELLLHQTITHLPVTNEPANIIFAETVVKTRYKGEK